MTYAFAHAAACAGNENAATNDGAALSSDQGLLKATPRTTTVTTKKQVTRLPDGYWCTPQGVIRHARSSIDVCASLHIERRVRTSSQAASILAFRLESGTLDRCWLADLTLATSAASQLARRLQVLGFAVNLADPRGPALLKQLLEEMIGRTDPSVMSSRAFKALVWNFGGRVA